MTCTQGVILFVNTRKALIFFVWRIGQIGKIERTYHFQQLPILRSIDMQATHSAIPSRRLNIILTLTAECISSYTYRFVVRKPAQNAE